MKKLITLLLFTVIISSSFAQSKIACGDTHTLMIRGDGTLWAWGSNVAGELGIGFTTIYTTPNPTPVQVGVASNWASVNAGPQYSMSIKTDGTLWAWGGNNQGQLGDGSTINRLSPVQIGNATNWVKVECGFEHTVALQSNGTLWAWGRNLFGQLGDGTTVSQNSPHQIGTLTSWVDVATGGWSTFAVKSNGTVWACGDNTFGQLGDGTYIDRSLLVQVSGITSAIKVAAGNFNSLALLSNGTVRSWGVNSSGELGNGTTNWSNVPILVTGVSTATKIACGGHHNIILLVNGTLRTFGSNIDGELGDGTNINRSTAVVASGVANVLDIDGGSNSGYDEFSGVIKSTNTSMACMTGYNDYGQLGDGTTTSRNTFGCVAVGPTSIVTSLIPGNPFCAGSNVNVAYTVTGNINAGNIFTAQLSDAAGSFTSPVTIGTLTSTGNGTINANLPSGTPSGSGYRIRVISNNPSTTGTDNGIDLTIIAALTWYLDADNDQYYINSQPACSNPGPGWHLAPVIAEGDCDDFNGAFNAGAIDVCNGIDDNCNGIIDDAFTSGIAQFAYYPTTDSAFVRVLNLTTQSIVATIPVGQYPVAASANPEGTKVYIANKNSNTISVIDVATQTVSTTIPVGNAPVDVEVSRDGTKVYVANSVSNTISVINANTNTVSNTINLANQPKYLELHPGGNKLYISTNVGITIANITNNTILSNIQISNATNIVFTNDGSKGYLASGGFAIVINPIVDTISYLPGSTYGFDYQCIGLSQDNHYLFVSAKTSIAPFARYNLLTLTWDINLGGSNEPYFANSGIVHNVNLGLDYVLLAGRLKIIQANSLTTIQTIPMFNPNPNQNVNPYVLINGSFIAFLHPEINLKGGWPSTSILDGDNSPSLSDYTDFGNINTTGFSYKTYRIENNGLAPLHICNISLSGPHASMFTLGPLPSTIPVGGVDSLTVYFYPSSPGIKSATVTIINNDLTEGVFNFSIQGTGTLPKLAYITHSSANTVGVYDINSYTHLQDINVGTYPNGLALNPSKNKLYVTNSNANTVSVINTFSNQVIASVAVGNNPVGVCVSPNGNKIYVANKNSNTISVIDALTNSIVSTINVGTAPTGICILPDSSKVYVTNNGSNTISIINTTTNSVTATLAVGIAPYGITPSSDGTKVYIANSGSNTVSVLNTSNNSFSIPYTTGGYPYSIAVNSSGSTIYVSNYTDFTVSAINTLMGFSNTVPVGNYPAGMSFSEDESQLFVSCYGNDTMTVINTMMNFVSNSFTTGSGPLSFGNSVGTIPVPQIEVKGGGLLLPITIENYDYTPSTGDNTDFGQVNGGNSLTHTFYIQNLGNTELNISNVEMYGPDTSMFYFGNIPTSVAPNATDSFTITFTPTALGIKTAYIHISSNVPNLGNYYYGVQGEGVGSFTTTFNLKLFIEGYYSGGGLMQPVLFNAGASLMNTSCDSITIELHDPFTFNTIFTNRVMLNTSGIATVNYPHSISGGNYYIVVRTRNTIETWSKLPVTFNSSSVFFDFSSQ